VEKRALTRRREFDAFVAGLVEAAAREGDLAPDVDPALVSRLIWGMINSIVEWYRPRGDNSAEEIADAVVTLVFHGLRRAPSDSS
jgi:hypothetical protein